MPEPVVCPSCRSNVSIPADHAEPTIRCGICWAEVAVADRRPTAPRAPEPVAPPVAAPRATVAHKPAVTLPGKPLPGMAKLEDRLLRAANRIAPPPAPVLAKPVAAAVPVKPPAALPEIQPAAPPIPPAPVVPIPEPDLISAEIVPDEPEDRPIPPAPPTRSAPARPRAEPSRRSSRVVDDDDEDLDRPRRRSRAKPQPKSPLPWVIGGCVFLAILLGGAYAVSRAVRGPSDRDPVPIAEGNDDPAVQFNLPNINPNPPANPKGPPALPVPPAPPAIGFNPFPNIPNIQPPGANLAMVEHTGDGYTAKIFGRPSEHPTLLNLYDDAFLNPIARAKRMQSSSTPPSSRIEITTVDVPQGVTPDLKKIITESSFRRGEVKPTTWAGLEGLELVETLGGRTVTSRIVQSGCRIVLVKFTITEIFGDRRGAETAQKDFFDSFKITFDPKTEAPIDPRLVPRKPVRPPNVPKRPGQP